MATEYNQPLYLCFIDFNKAIDTAKLKKLWWKMLDIGFRNYLVPSLANRTKKTVGTSRPKGGKLSRRVVSNLERSVTRTHQRRIDIVAEMEMRRAVEGYKGRYRISGKRINNLRYADDIALSV